jgi:hypothetical protein
MIASLIAGWATLYCAYILGYHDSTPYAIGAIIMQLATIVTAIYLAWRHLP